MPSMPLPPPSRPPDDEHSTATSSARSSHSSSLRHRAEDLQREPLLLGMAAVCAFLLTFQLAIILVHPPWVGPTTDWLRTALSWPALAVLVAVSRWLSRRRQPEALSWWLFSGGVLCYAIARTWWTIDDTLIYHHGVPFPIQPDLVFMLQYPFYFLAVILIPYGEGWGPWLLAVLDALLWMGAATAVAWYFLLAPLFAESGLSPLATAVSLGYPVADLFLLLAVLLHLLRPLRYSEDLPVMLIIIAAFACLVVADAGAIVLSVSPAPMYHSGQLPDFFWLAADLLLPVAAVVQVGIVQRARLGVGAQPGLEGTIPQGLQGHAAEDVQAAMRLFLPLVAALLASAAILLRAAATSSTPAGFDWRQMVAPLAVTSGLMLLVIVRQAVLFLEMTQLRRDMEVAKTNERTLRELNRHKDEFLAVVSHELRTPLTTLEIFFGLLARRIATLPPREVEPLRTPLTHSWASVRRLSRLAGDLVDNARVAQGRIPVHMEPCDLRTIVRGAVEEQSAEEPGRTISLELPSGGQPVPVRADADRIGQVVTNYLTNALKYSSAGQPVTVHLEVVEGAGNGNAQHDGERGSGARALARVSVHDEGVGVPLAAQPHIWERYHVVEGTRVQSTSGISLGLGLHICKTIIEDHHGQVGVESASGHGTTFWFTLPLATAA